MIGSYKGPNLALIAGSHGGLGRSEEGDTVGIEGGFFSEFQ